MTTTASTDKPLKAFSVQGYEYGAIVFAKSGIAARRLGANELNCEFEYIESCRRVPALDKYADSGVPWRVLVEDYGWFLDCGNCGVQVYNDVPDRVWLGDELYCSAKCRDEHIKILNKGGE